VSKPALFSLLEDTKIPDLSVKVAKEIADSLGVTKKFVDFLIKYKPAIPEKRPETFCQMSWEEEALRKAFRKIYQHRSTALHTGIPFPAPMCERPYYQKGWEAYAEKPIGLGMGVHGGQWLIEDTPMTLHSFEYIARNAIINWWETVAGEDHEANV